MTGIEVILVRHCRTNLFLIGDYDWTIDEEAARHFHTASDAMTYCVKHDISHAQVVRRDVTGIREVVIPIPHRHELESAA